MHLFEAKEKQSMLFGNEKKVRGGRMIKREISSVDYLPGQNMDIAFSLLYVEDRYYSGHHIAIMCQLLQ